LWRHLVAALLSFQAVQSSANPLLLIASFAAVALTSAGGEALYRRIYRSQQFDLLATRNDSDDGD
jgi:hypothetical protein